MSPAPFMSPDWLALVEARLQMLLDADPVATAANMLVLECFQGLPSSTLIIRIKAGRAEVRRGLTKNERATMTIHCDWSDAHRAACLTGDALERFREWQVDQNRISIEGSLGAAAPLFHALHNFIATLTIPPEEQSL